MKSILLVFILIPIYVQSQINKIYLPVLKNQLWGYIDTTGSYVSEPQYQSASVFYFDTFAVVQKSARFNVINKQFNTIFPSDYQEIKLISKNLIALATNNDFLLYNSKGQQLNSQPFEAIIPFHNYFKIFKKNKCALIDSTGKTIIPLEYTRIQTFTIPSEKNQTFFLVSDDKKIGLYSLAKKLVLPIAFDEIALFNDSIIQFKMNKFWGYMHKNGYKISEPKWTDMSFMTKNIVIVTGVEGRTLLEYKTGKQILSAYYDDIYYESDTVLFVRKGSKVGAVNWKNKLIIDIKFDNIKYDKVGFYIVLNNRKTGIYNLVGDTILPDEYDQVSLVYPQRSSFTNNVKYFFKIGKKKKFGLASFSGEIYVPPYYDNVTVWNDSVFHVVRNKQVGLFLYQKKIYDTKFDFVGFEPLGFYTARFGQKFALANADSVLYDCVCDKIVFANQSIKVYRGKDMDIIECDKKGKIIEQFTYNNIPRYNIANPETTDYSKWSSDVGFWDWNYKWQFWQKNGKWGYGTNNGDFDIKPFCQSYLATQYERTILTQTNCDSTYYNVGLAKFVSNKQFGYFDMERIKHIYEPQFIYVEYPTKSNIELDNGLLYEERDSYLSTNGLFTYFHGQKYSYIDEKNSNIRRFIIGGKLLATKQDTGYALLPLYDYYCRLRAKAPITCDDSNTALMLMNDSVQLRAVGGFWNYSIYDRPRNQNINNGSFLYADTFADDRALVINQIGKSGIISKSDSLIIPFNYEKIELTRTKTDTLYRISFVNQRFGAINSTGKISVLTQFDEMKDFSQGLAPVRNDKLWGFVNYEGDTVVEIKYTEVQSFSEGLAAVQINGKYGFINLKGEVVIDFQFSRASSFCEGRAQVQVKKRIKYVNAQGDFLDMGAVKKIGSFTKGAATVKKTKKYSGVVDTLGTYIVSARYDKIIQVIPNECAIVQKKKKFALIQVGTNEKLTKFDYTKMYACSENMIRFQKDKLYGFLNVKGEEVIPAQFASAADFHNGLALAKLNKRFGYINTKGEFVINEQFAQAGDFCNGIAYVKKGKQQFCINKENKILYEIKDFNITSRNDDTIMVAQNENKQYFFLSISGYRLYNKTFEDAKLFAGNYALVKENGKWGAINRKGNYVLQPTYYQMSNFAENHAVVVLSPVEGICDFKGNVLISPQYEKAIPLDNHIIRTELNGKIGYQTTTGKVIWDLQK